MVKKKVKKVIRKSVKRGLGLVDKLIDKLPVELHLPSYNYCGPGTKLSERLARGDKGVNGLDEMCKTHDIAYATHKDSAGRYTADKELASGALKRLFSKDASLGERAASLLVTSAMKTKMGLSKFGGSIFRPSIRRRQRSGVKKSNKKSSFAALVRDAKNGMKKSKARSVSSAIMAALRSAKKFRKGKRIAMPRIIKVPKISGGILPLLPILAGLGAVGSLVGSTANVVRSVNAIRKAGEQLEENKRHNRAMEMKIGSGLYLGMRKHGSGLYLRPKASGNGLYLKPASKNYR